ncbi:MAG: hypothetical protein WDN49_15555 [Acetobacteraceae bacterium]
MPDANAAEARPLGAMKGAGRTRHARRAARGGGGGRAGRSIAACCSPASARMW